jgi:hypothetical protein
LQNRILILIRDFLLIYEFKIRGFINRILTRLLPVLRTRVSRKRAISLFGSVALIAADDRGVCVDAATIRNGLGCSPTLKGSGWNSFAEVQRPLRPFLPFACLIFCLFLTAISSWHFEVL